MSKKKDKDKKDKKQRAESGFAPTVLPPRDSPLMPPRVPTEAEFEAETNETPPTEPAFLSWLDRLGAREGPGARVTLALARIGVVTLPILLLLITLWGVTGGETPLAVQLADPAAARGLITLLFAAATIWIALLLATFALTGEVSDRQFKQTRGVLTPLVLILALVLGYYMGVGAFPRSQSAPAEVEVEVERARPDLEFEPLPDPIGFPSSEPSLTPAEPTQDTEPAPDRSQSNAQPRRRGASRTGPDF